VVPGQAEIIVSMRHLPEGPALPAEPGLCGACRHASVKGTNRGTAYLRCTRASWDDRLARYPRLPVTSCIGFQPTEELDTSGKEPGARADGLDMPDAPVDS
jgi:hypothetical protein